MITLAVIVSLGLNVWLWYRLSKLEALEIAMRTEKIKANSMYNEVGGFMERINFDLRQMKGNRSNQPRDRHP